MTSSSDHITVSEFYDKWGKQLSLSLTEGSEILDGKVTGMNIHVPDSLYDNFPGGHIIFLSPEIIAEAAGLDERAQSELITNINRSEIPCIVIHYNVENEPIPLLKHLKSSIPVFKTAARTEDFLFMAEKLLRSTLTPFSTLHGVLLDIHRLGVLITGKSGVGKSESALDLINKGSKLIADDVIEIRKINDRVIGTGPENIRHLMEIRGVGIVNIKDLYGTTCVMNEREIDLVIELEHWDQKKEYDRLGIDIKKYRLMDVYIPYLLIPVSPGRNTSTIIDVAVRNQLLRADSEYEKNSGILRNIPADGVTEK